MEDPEFRRIADTSERLIAFAAEPVDWDSFDAIWQNLTNREQRMVAYSLANMVGQVRAERGDPPGSLYGPPD